MIQLEKVCFDRGKKRLLKQIDLQLAPGKLTMVIGENGAGKSTLLRLLSGELAVTSGTISLWGQTIQNYPIAELAKFRAMLSQHNSLEFALTVAELVTLGRFAHRHEENSRQRQALVQESLEALEVADLGPRNYLELSGGQQQRVQMARVWCQLAHLSEQQKALMLLDEPTAALDPRHQHRFLKQLKNWCQGKRSAVAVVHDLNLAARYADVVLILKSGELLGAGPTQQVLTPEALERAFSVKAVVQMGPEEVLQIWFREAVE